MARERVLEAKLKEANVQLSVLSNSPSSSERKVVAVQGQIDQIRKDLEIAMRQQQRAKQGDASGAAARCIAPTIPISILLAIYLMS